MIHFNYEILLDEKNFINNIIDYNEEDEFELYNLYNYNKIIHNKKNEDNTTIIFPFKSIAQDNVDFNEFLNNIKLKEKKDIRINKINFICQKNETNPQTYINNTNIKVKKLLGRKRKNSTEKRNHNNCSYDNLLRKIKHLLIEASRVLINNRIQNVYEILNDKSMELVKIKQDQANNTKIEFNQQFIMKTLKDILSDDATTKNNCTRDHNKKLIEKLLNEEDCTKRKIFEKLFNFTFMDLIKYARNQREGLDELKGLTLPKALYESMANDEEYAISFIHTLFNYEKLLYKKKPRTRRKKSNNLFKMTK